MQARKQVEIKAAAPVQAPRIVRSKSAKTVVSKTVSTKAVVSKAVAPKTVASKTVASKTVAATKNVVAKSIPSKSSMPSKSIPATIKSSVSPKSAVPSKTTKTMVPATTAASSTSAPPPAVASVVAAPAKSAADEFKVGDKAVYPARGVAEVVSIEERDIAGNRQRFYTLRLLDTDHKIMVPVSNAVNIGLRKPISDKQIKEIFRILKVTDIAFDNQTWNRRYRGFMDKIKTGSVFDVAEVLRDLSRLKTNKALSFGERQMLEKARGLIVKEISVARGKSEDKIRTEIDSIFGPS